MSKKSVKLTQDQWDRVLKTTFVLTHLAEELHDLSHVESLLTRISADEDLATACAMGLEYTDQAAGSAETVAEFMKQRTFAVQTAASDFLDFMIETNRELQEKDAA